METALNKFRKIKSLPYLGFTFLTLLCLMRCGESDDPGIMNGDVNAFAGNDQNVLVSEEVTLNGSGSSSSGSVEYSWRFISTPSSSAALLLNEVSKNPKFTPDRAGKYKLELTVSDNGKALDTVTVAAFSVKNINGNYKNIVPGPNVGIRDFEVTLDTLYITCEFNKIGELEIRKIACFDGFDWAALGCGLEEGSIYDMIKYDGDLYVTGEFEEIGCIVAHNIARWDGSSWYEVGGGITGNDPFGNTLAIYKGDLYVGGRFTKAGNVSVANIAKWDGTSWSEAGTFSDGSVRKLQIYKQELIAGGFFTTVNGIKTGYVASFDGSSWQSMGSTGVLELKSTGAVTRMAVMKDVLYLAGEFDSNGNTISELITWDGSVFNDFGRAFSLSQNRIRELSVVNDKLYIGGDFSAVVGAQAKNILQWDGENWGIMGQGIAGSVLAIVEYQDEVYIGGDFLSAGGTTAENISIWTEN